MDTVTLVEEWSSLPQAQKEILGMPNFMCGKAARRLSEMGFICAKKAEEEQALVIHLALKFYKEYGESWLKELNNYMANPPK